LVIWHSFVIRASSFVSLKSRRPLILALGEILWDLLPSGKQLGGAPANFAYHAAQLGADAKIVSAVGDDDLGHEILDRLRALHLDTTYVAVDPRRPTGTVTVSLDSKGVPTYTIHENVAWDFIPTTPALLDLASRADCVCFGTLAQRCDSGDMVGRVLTAARPDALRIFDANFRQHYYGCGTVHWSLLHSNVLKLNDAEFAQIPRLCHSNESPLDPAPYLFTTYDRLRTIAVTRGADGSILYSRDGPSVEHPGHPAATIGDTVGAGDAFTAALAMGLLRNVPLKRINDNANRLAGYVCTQPGATPPIPQDLLRRLV
jgi:fructokinase